MKDKNKLNAAVVERHVTHLKKLDGDGKLVLCGPFAEGGGMVAIRAVSKESAALIAESDPFIAEGYKTFELKTLERASTENNYLL